MSARLVVSERVALNEGAATIEIVKMAPVNANEVFMAGFNNFIDIIAVEGIIA
jgi:hypothetical protein